MGPFFDKLGFKPDRIFPETDPALVAPVARPQGLAMHVLAPKLGDRKSVV